LPEPAGPEEKTAMSETETPQSPSLGLISRAVGMITSPGATFVDVVRAPRPAAILLVVAAVIAMAATVPQMTEKGRLAVLNTQVQTMERIMGPLDDEVYNRLEEQSHSNTRHIYSIVGTFIWLPIMATFFTALLWGLFNVLMGGGATFKQVLGIVTHSMVIVALGAAVSAPIQMMQSTFSLTGPFNLGALVPMLNPESFIVRFLSFTNAFTIWQMIVLAIGLGVLYKRKSTGIAIGLLAAYGLLVAIGVAVFSVFMSRMSA
jgi:hypothetical protein